MTGVFQLAWENTNSSEKSMKPSPHIRIHSKILGLWAYGVLLIWYIATPPVMHWHWFGFHQFSDGWLWHYPVPCHGILAVLQLSSLFFKIHFPSFARDPGVSTHKKIASLKMGLFISLFVWANIFLCKNCYFVDLDSFWLCSDQLCYLDIFVISGFLSLMTKGLLMFTI